jgi:hypothetical protein
MITVHDTGVPAIRHGIPPSRSGIPMGIKGKTTLGGKGRH